MSDTLVFHTYESIFYHAKELLDEAAEIKDKKQRRDRLKKLKEEPMVRMWQLIQSAAGYKSATPRNLNEDELLFEYALKNIHNLKVELKKFRQEVLQPVRNMETCKRWCRNLSNIGNQHPDYRPGSWFWEFLTSRSNFQTIGRTYYEEMLTRYSKIDYDRQLQSYTV